MKKLKIFSYIYVLLFPYLIVMALLLFLPKLRILLLVLSIIFLTVMSIITCISCNIYAVGGKGSGFNIATKIVYIPVHLFMLIFFAGMMNPFLFLASWIPLAISTGLLVFSGLCNIGNCIGLFRQGKCSFVKAVILCIMGFVYVLDIIGGIIQLITSFKKKVG